MITTPATFDEALRFLQVADWHRILGESWMDVIRHILGSFRIVIAEGGGYHQLVQPPLKRHRRLSYWFADAHTYVDDLNR